MLATFAHLGVMVIVIIGYLGVAAGGKRHDLPSTQHQSSFHCLSPSAEEEWRLGKSSLASTNQVSQQPVLPTLVTVNIISLH